MENSFSAPPPGPLPTPLPVIVEGYFGPVMGELIWLERDRLAFWTPMALPGNVTLLLRLPLPRTIETADVLLRADAPTNAVNASGQPGFVYAGHFDMLSPDAMRRLRRSLRRARAAPPPASAAPNAPPPPPSTPPPTPPAILALLGDDDPSMPDRADPPDAQLLIPRVLGGSTVTLGVTVPEHADLAQSLRFRGLTVSLTVAVLDWLAEGEPVEVQLRTSPATVIALSGEVAFRWRGRMSLTLRVRPGRDLLNLVAATERNAPTR